MQWNTERNAGFSTGTPWMKVNPNYVDINVEEQKSDKNSVLNFYKQLIKIRKQHDVLVYGTYKLLAEEDSAIYAYTRTLEGKTAVVICNMSPKNQTFEFPSESSFVNREVLIHNYPLDKNETLEKCTLHPYETRVYLLS
jgi:oligo-1,6-glucosidase/alpha-glucosidase